MKAMALPLNDTQPISRPSIPSTMAYTAGLGPPSECRCASDRKTTMEISAAAPPPTPLKMATSCGMAVIFTRRATGTAITAPSTMATSASTRLVVW